MEEITFVYTHSDQIDDNFKCIDIRFCCSFLCDMPPHFDCISRLFKFHDVHTLDHEHEHNCGDEITNDELSVMSHTNPCRTAS